MTSLRVEGLAEAADAKQVLDSLRAVPGVTTAQVNLTTKTAQVTGDVSVDLLLAAVESTGREVVQVIDTTCLLRVDGMFCEHCSSAVEEALRAVPGVATAVVNLDGKLATVNGTANLHELISAVESTGKLASLAPKVGSGQTMGDAVVWLKVGR